MAFGSPGVVVPFERFLSYRQRLATADGTVAMPTPADADVPRDPAAASNDDDDACRVASSIVPVTPQHGGTQ